MPRGTPCGGRIRSNGDSRSRRLYCGHSALITYVCNTADIMNKEKTFTILLGVVILAAYLIAGSLLDTCDVEKIPADNPYQQYSDIYENDSTMTICDSVYFYIKELRIAHPDVVMAQCIEESGNFTSSLFLEGNNCLGMKLPCTRPTLANGTIYGHAYYESIKDCLADYAIWQSCFARGKDRDAYLRYLDDVYAEKPGYSKRLINIINTRKL